MVVSVVAIFIVFYVIENLAYYVEINIVYGVVRFVVYFTHIWKTCRMLPIGMQTRALR